MCSGNCNCSCKGEPGPRGIQGVAGPMGPQGADAGVSNVFEASLSLTSAEILLLFTSPITIVPSPGVGKYIEVISATAEMTASAPYAGNTLIQLLSSGAGIEQYYENSVLVSTLSRNCRFVAVAVNPFSTGVTQVLTNVALQVKVQSGNPIGGSGTVKIKLLYRIVTL